MYDASRNILQNPNRKCKHVALILQLKSCTAHFNIFNVTSNTTLITQCCIIQYIKTILTHDKE